ncbi:MAG: OmpA family protein, partial [Steroidobacteraceae bacterium]
MSIGLVCGLVAQFGAWPALAQTVTPPGTQVHNYAEAHFDRAVGLTDTVRSNEVVTTVAPGRSRAAVQFVRTVASGSGTASTSGPTSCFTGGVYQPLVNPVLIGGQTLDPTQPVPLASTGMYHGGEPFFVRLTDPDRNRDASALDTVDIRVRSVATGDSEVLRLTETGTNTGEFVGYVPSAVGAAVANNCVLEAARESDITTDYLDPLDSSDSVQATARLDPVGLVFNSSNGTPVDGARVRIVDAVTGQPAQVYGDDGTSVFPSEVVAGGQATDSGGTLYTFAAGRFRFPVIANAGSYRLVVEPPASFAYPSAVSMAQLQTLAGAPFKLNSGSFGIAYSVFSPPAGNIDVPLDPTGTALVVNKTTPTAVAAVGDFIQYSVTVENTGASGAFPSVTTIDTLPLGARYVRGSARLNDQPTADPAIDATGRRLSFTTGDLEPSASITIRYVVELTSGVHGKELTNEVQAIGFGNVASNKASATIRVRDELLKSAAIVAGRVVEGDCPIDVAAAQGVEGVRVYLEDGRYAVTDKEGKYHFEGVPPGSHVVQMDTDTIPPALAPAQCTDHARFAGRAYSQFVDLRGGALWRADFTLTRRPPPAGTVTLRMRSQVNAAANRVSVALPLEVSGINVGKLRVLVMLADGLRYRKGSARLGGIAIDDPAGNESLLSFNLGEAPAPWSRELDFDLEPGDGARGALTLKAVALFDTPTATNQKTDPVENHLERGAAVRQSAHYVFVPRFAVLGTELTAADRVELDRIARDWRGVYGIQVRAVGHTDNTPISTRNRGLYADNYELSLARARTVADYVREKLQLDAGQFEILGRGADEPIELGKDPASLAKNRRVEVSITGMRPVSDGTLTVTQGESAATSAATRGIIMYGRLPGGRVPDAPATDILPPATVIAAEPKPVAPVIAWVTPVKDFNPPIPSLKVAVEHLYDQKVKLLVNGVRVNDVTFDGATPDPAKTFAISAWRGVALADGDNRLTAVVIDAGGQEVERLERDVHYSGGPVRADLLGTQSRLVADGRTRPVIT